MQGNPSTRQVYILIGLLYLGFVIYGSLIPFHVQIYPIAEAIRKFRQIPYLHLGIQSRSDLVANILLFIPLSFLLMGTWCGPTQSWYVKAAGYILVFLFCSLLSIGVEFTQTFFPLRTVSLNDILAETAGAGIGILLWHWRGPKITTWAESIISERRPRSLAESMFYGYVVALLFFSIFPLDLTISPVEIYHKWKEGRVVFVPFSGNHGSTGQFIYDILTDIALFVPIGFLAGKIRKNPPNSPLNTAASHSYTVQYITRGLWMGITIAAVIEFMQIFVWSRTTDITDLITGGFGGVLGGFLAYIMAKGAICNGVETIPNRKPLRLINSLLVSGYIGTLLLIHWGPFNFTMDRAVISSNIEHISIIPFYNYYFASEFQALTQALRKFIFFVPLGILLGWRLQRTKGMLFWVISLFSLVLLAAGIEAGQLFLPGRYPDVTDALLGLAGGISGIWIYRRSICL